MFLVDFLLPLIDGAAEEGGVEEGEGMRRVSCGLVGAGEREGREKARV